jgi:hypothetical protein
LLVTQDEKLYTMVSYQPCKDFKGLQTTVVDAEEEIEA